ncbi:MAG: DNA repair protein RadC [Pseudomonadota bacterium]
MISSSEQCRDGSPHRAGWPDPAGGPREALWMRGAGTLGDDELLAILLGTGRTGASALDLAREILGHRRVDALLQLAPAQLARLSGVGKAKAARVLAAIELGRRALSAPLQRGVVLDGPARVAAIYGPRLGGLDEHFVVLHLDARHRLLGEVVAARGGADRCPVPVREILTHALAAGASALLCVHNHPSGDAEPSPEDIALTRRLAQATQLVGLVLLDHVIVAGPRHVSLRERGVLDDSVPR